MNDYYVYAHETPDGKIFYVGKGRGRRQYQTGNRNKYWQHIKNRYGYISKLLENNLTEQQAYEKEILWIKQYKSIGQCIANFTNGGDGVRVEKRWWGAAISNALIGTERAMGKQNKSYKNLISKTSLSSLYTQKGLSSVEIGKKCGLSYTTIISRLREYGIGVRKCGKKNKKIICLTDGKTFASISDAAKNYNLFRENIRKVLYGKYKCTGGKSFSFINDDR